MVEHNRKKVKNFKKSERNIVYRNGVAYIPLYLDEKYFLDIEDKIKIEFRKSSKKMVISAMNN